MGRRILSAGELARAAGDVLVDVAGDIDPRVTGVAYDSNRVRPGDLFFCVPGTRRDGHEFAPEALRAGASALCVERTVVGASCQIVVTNVRRAMARIAAEFFGRPADHLLMLGVTGTNGKSTTVYLLGSILRAGGRSPGLIGTIETRAPGITAPGVRTTPESVDLQALLARMHEGGADSLAMEVTSHGIALERVEGVRFNAAAFTNLSQDHLDFHKTMEDYFAAKRALFEPGRVDRAAICIDDDYGRRLADSIAVPAMTFGVSGGADVHGSGVELGPSGARFVAATPEGEIELTTPLIGEFNVVNCLAAVATALQAGIGPDVIASGIRALHAVPGRFEPVDCGQPFSVIVDYSHTPKSLENALRAARGITTGRVICVFGCGGDRDRAKRPLMGRVAAELADATVVTSDNPRTEDPDEIIEEIVVGHAQVRSGAPNEIIADRRRAIVAALTKAHPGDVVLIAGKGHETGQQFAHATVPFDDRVVARDALAALGWEQKP